MNARIDYNGQLYTIDLAKPLDISIPVRGDARGVNAWGMEAPSIRPHTEGDFVGKVSAGASVNFNTVHFNPHAHGTHTECIGHITEEFHSINQHVKQFFFMAELISVSPALRDGDWTVSRAILEKAFVDGAGWTSKESAESIPQAVIIRTLPNDGNKATRQYSGTNPPYLLEDAVLFLVEKGVAHLLVDLPSVDREKDGGRLLAHRAFWGVKNQQATNEGGKFKGGTAPRKAATITELVYVPDTIQDGNYFLNLQVAAFENDASPSRPVLYAISEPRHP